MLVVAVVGVSGVGKSTVLRELSKRMPIRHLQASDLIKAEQARLQRESSTSEELRAGPILDNQALLLNGFNHAVEGCSNLIAFDGHVLIDTNDGLIEIPSSVFKSLNCCHIAVLVDLPSKISLRRANDSMRVRPSRSPAEIREQQARLVELSKQIAGELGVPVTIHQASNASTLEHVLRKLVDA